MIVVEDCPCCDEYWSLIDRLKTAEAEVARLRSAIKRGLADINDPLRIEHLREALVDTGPKR